MDRSRRLARSEARRDARRDAPREAGREAAGGGRTVAPAASRLTLRRPRNRRRAGSVWSRLPQPSAIADACGRLVRRSLPAAAALAALAVLGGALWAGYRWLTRSPRFAITEIAVHGAHRVDPDTLRARLPLRIGDNVFADLAAAARAAGDDPWIATVDVRRILPHTIAVELREHTAAVVAALGEDELYLVDAAGRPFKRAAIEAGEADGLPIVTGIDRAAFAADPAAALAALRAALTAVERWRAASRRPAIGEVHIDPHGAVTLHTYDPAIAIQLGALGDDAGARLHAFDAAWAGLSDTERARARAIHLGARPDHVTVAFATD
ncbi:MAG TPA: FtsQ-type POTRA domain-containing protein [Kofleriaceae bacterium]|nr:FtsQ-type POTRA domain-containing protein [Kofleriaceae bacterium]